MSWRYIDPLLEKLSKHSTIVTKYWVCLVVIFRLTMLAFADRVWSDEQKEFKCNTKEVGCDNVCFNRFTPISNVRLWGLQLLALCIPSALYLVYIWHLVSRAQHDAEDAKQKQRAMKALMDVRLKQTKNNNALQASLAATGNAPAAVANANTNANNNQAIEPTTLEDNRNTKSSKPNPNQNNNNNINLEDYENDIYPSTEKMKKQSKFLQPHCNYYSVNRKDGFLNDQNKPSSSKTSFLPAIFRKNNDNKNENENEEEQEGNYNNNNNIDYFGPKKSPQDNRIKNWVRNINAGNTKNTNNNNNDLIGANNIGNNNGNNQNNTNFAFVEPSDHQSALTAELKQINKRLNKYDNYDRFNRTILPNDWRGEAKKRPRNERNIWRFYLLQLVLRTITDVVFVWMQYRIYPYKFIIPELYICGDVINPDKTYPCRHQVDCFVSRPYEKTVFFIYFYIVAALCFMLNIFEFWYIGFDRLRHAFARVDKKKLEEIEKDKLKRLERENQEKLMEHDRIKTELALEQNNAAGNVLRQRKPNSNKNLNNNLLMNPKVIEDFSNQNNVYIQATSEINQEPQNKIPILPPKVILPTENNSQTSKQKTNLVPVISTPTSTPQNRKAVNLQTSPPGNLTQNLRNTTSTGQSPSIVPKKSVPGLINSAAMRRDSHMSRSIDSYNDNEIQYSDKDSIAYRANPMFTEGDAYRSGKDDHFLKQIA